MDLHSHSPVSLWTRVLLATAPPPHPPITYWILFWYMHLVKRSFANIIDCDKYHFSLVSFQFQQRRHWETDLPLSAFHGRISVVKSDLIIHISVVWKSDLIIHISVVWKSDLIIHIWLVWKSDLMIHISVVWKSDLIIHISLTASKLVLRLF